MFWYTKMDFIKTFNRDLSCFRVNSNELYIIFIYG